MEFPSKKQTIKITSNQQGSLFVSVIRSGIPVAGDEKAEEKNLSITVVYKTSKGEVLLPESIEQGTDFIAEVSIVNKGNTGEVKNIALSQVFPSGWEIQNMRLDNTQHLVNESTYDYRDIRDDRVNTFFSLPASGSKRFKVLLTATYAGRYYLPAVNCAAMYDNTSYARTKGTWVEVIKKATMP